MKSLPRAIWILGFVSLLTDFSSEMIFPLLPVFLTTVLGASTIVLGTIEGVAEATASILKVFSGYWTDRFQKRKPLIVAGYSLAGIVRPLIGLANSWGAVLFLRFMDRVGKGLRTSPRDALIADVADQRLRGQAYGLHRGMDHAGAVIGPLVAAFLLNQYGLSLRTVFLLAAVPAIMALIVLGWFLKEPKTEEKPKEKSSPFNLFKEARGLKNGFPKLLLILLLFTLGNSTDAFLLLRLTEAGVDVASIAVLWSLIHVVKMTSNFLGGRATDKFGPKRMMIAAWVYFGLIYVAFAVINDPQTLTYIFLAYGLFYGLSEPAERALVAVLAPAHLRGTAFGLYHLTTGIALLPASLLFGFLWKYFGHHIPFLIGAALAGVASVLLIFWVRQNGRANQPPVTQS